MADPLRDQDTSSRIEELLLAGLDHYFSGHHELAISVWTRVLFLDRSHARARAYIDRARGAIAERQREGEELLQMGLAAFTQGDADAARRLLTSAVERGAQPEEALAALERLDRLAPAEPLAVEPPGRKPQAARASELVAQHRRGASPATLLLVLAIGLASGVLVMLAWSSGVFPWGPAAPAAPVPAARQIQDPLPVPSASEVSLARATAWYKNGRLRDALAALDAIRPGDPLRAQADDLRATIQQKLLEAAHATPAHQ